MDFLDRKIISLDLAKRLSKIAEDKAIAMNVLVSIAIVDGSGKLLHFIRMDDSTDASVFVAIEKAMHSSAYKRPTKFHEELLEKGNSVVLGLPHSIPLEGGIPIVINNVAIGAIGVAGAKSEEDGIIAQAAVDYANSKIEQLL